MTTTTQDSLFDKPPADIPARPYADRVPYVRGSDTSKAAAESQEPTLGTKQAEVLNLIRESEEFGLTDDDLERATGWRHQSVSARRRELVLAGHIRDSGQRRQTSSGRQATVWVAVT